jgi:hypothetical protein
MHVTTLKRDFAQKLSQNFTRATSTGFQTRTIYGNAILQWGRPENKVLVDLQHPFYVPTRTTYGVTFVFRQWEMIEMGNDSKNLLVQKIKVMCIFVASCGNRAPLLY